jgi:hypothetical protein
VTSEPPSRPHIRCQDEAKNVSRANDECEEALLQVVGVRRGPYLPEAARTG